MYLVKIEAGRMRVELERHAPLLRPLNHAFDVQRVRRTLTEQTPSRVSEDAQIFVVHGPQDTLGLLSRIELEFVVDRCHHEIEALQQAVAEIELAVGKDIDFR